MNEFTRILIIDDDPDYVDSIKSILEEADHHVDVAYNPKDGFEKLQSNPPDLLLLDIRMGRGAEGVKLARKIRKDPELKEIPILFITGIKEQLAYLFPGEQIHPHIVPVDELVEKPVEPQFLLERVSSLLHAADSRKLQTN